jgi:hypothetical protein
MADKKNKNEFPGYPHYPASEDIMNSKDNERVEVDVENLSRSKEVLPDKSVRPPQAENTDPVLSDVDADALNVDDDTKLSSGGDADITDEDLIALGEKDAQYENAESLTGNELDIPGAEDDDEMEEIGEEDEENNYYSLGGDAHENLEEDKGD